MVHAIPHSEATPYLYYLLAWPWTRLFGSGEVGLRSLSALAGTATVVAAYGAGASLVSRRVGLIAAALVAVNPFLIWYSQEARSYAVVTLFVAVGLWLFGRGLAGESRALAGWALVSGLALATHYFAVFVVVPEAIWLVLRGREQRTGDRGRSPPCRRAARRAAAAPGPARQRRVRGAVRRFQADRRRPQGSRGRIQLSRRVGRHHRRGAARPVCAGIARDPYACS